MGQKALAMLPCDLDKTRKIVFHALPPGQAVRVRELLHGVDSMEAHLGTNPTTLIVRCNVMHYTLDGLEAVLIAQGFCLDNTVQRIKRALICFCEAVQRENLAINASEVKSQKVFARVYEQHLHGDKDETPEEWRAYK